MLFIVTATLLSGVLLAAALIRLTRPKAANEKFAAVIFGMFGGGVLVFIYLLWVASGGYAPNTFSFHVKSGDFKSVEMRMCGSTTRLTKLGDRFVGLVLFNCDGGTELVLTQTNGEVLVCKESGYYVPMIIRHYSHDIDDKHLELCA